MGHYIHGLVALITLTHAFVSFPVKHYSLSKSSRYQSLSSQSPNSQSVLCKYGIIQFIQRRQFLLVDKIELQGRLMELLTSITSTHFVNKEEEVLVAGIEMSLNAESANVIKVVAVYVTVDAEKSTNDSAYSVTEVLGEWYT